jgi:hypothetical protein
MSVAQDYIALGSTVTIVSGRGENFPIIDLT